MDLFGFVRSYPKTLFGGSTVVGAGLGGVPGAVAGAVASLVLLGWRRKEDHPTQSQIGCDNFDYSLFGSDDEMADAFTDPAPGDAFAAAQGLGDGGSLDASTDPDVTDDGGDSDAPTDGSDDSSYDTSAADGSAADGSDGQTTVYTDAASLPQQAGFYQSDGVVDQTNDDGGDDSPTDLPDGDDGSDDGNYDDGGGGASGGGGGGDTSGAASGPTTAPSDHKHREWLKKQAQKKAAAATAAAAAAAAAAKAKAPIALTLHPAATTLPKGVFVPPLPTAGLAFHATTATAPAAKPRPAPPKPMSNKPHATTSIKPPTGGGTVRVTNPSPWPTKKK